jgi:hypothetical protein
MTMVNQKLIGLILEMQNALFPHKRKGRFMKSGHVLLLTPIREHDIYN